MTTSPAGVAGAHPRGPAPAPAPAPRLPMLGLLALSFSVFLSITSEMMPTGLLPEMSASLGVSEGRIGLLVTVFALTVVLTSALLVRVTRPLPRHGLMIAILAVLALCNLLTAILPTYPLIVAARVLGGLAHGMFWALTPAYAARLVPSALIGRAVTIALTGGTLAMVIGVPIGTALGQAVGWRWAFGMVAGALLLGMIAVIAWLPRVANAGPEAAPETAPETAPGAALEAAPGAGTRAPAARSGAGLPLALLCAVVALTMTGYYALFTYIAPFLLGAIGLPAAWLSPALFAFGAAGMASLLLTGGVLGARPIGGLLLGLVACAASVGGIGLLLGQPALALAAMALWGFSFGLIPPLAQTTMLRTAPPALRDAAGSFYTTAFNLGIGGGALLGNVLLALPGAGLAALPAVSAALTGLAAAVYVLSRRSIRAAVERNS